jgi:signal transduction histidine kinase/DNA-binding NarL/FixJ family response regulator/HAMP domain-containing protein
MKPRPDLATTEPRVGNSLPGERKERLSDRLKALMPLTFRGQAVLFLFPLIVIISMVYTFESISTERKILRNEIIKKGETIAAIAARNAELSLLSENVEQLKSSARPLMEIKDVAFVLFLNKRSEVLYHEGIKHSFEESLTLDSGRAVSFFEYHDYFEFIVPVVTVKAAEELFLLEGSGSAPPVREQIGWVCIGLSKEVMSRSERQIIVRSGITALLFSTVGIILLYMFIAFMTRPLYALINAVKDLREGEHHEVTVVSPRSEIGRLSAEFNRMSRAIKEREEALQENVMELEQTQDELQENVQELELQVEAREEAEAELRKHRDHLEDLVLERTAQLTVAKDQAEAANRAKSDFLASMSHELRTPLNAILGYAQILKHHDNLTESQRQQLGIMHGSGEHLLMLINDILDVGKIEACKMEVEDVVFDLPALVRQAFNLIRLHAEEKELRFEYVADTPLPSYVRGDERKLRQILLNLLSNSVKYTRRGSVTMRVSHGKAGPALFRCEVIDTGIGIPADQLEAVFEPFTQLVSDRQVREGSGLGLNISKRLLALMQGRMGVESVVGKGSTFWMEVALPALVDDEAALEKTDSYAIGYLGERRRILVVDDNVGNTSMLVSLLEPLGFKLDTAQNGVEALMRAEEHCPDLVLMDLVMPEMNGLEAATQMRKNRKLGETRIIGASATATDNACKEAFISSCDDFVTKPIRIDLLLEIIGVQLGIEWETAPSVMDGIQNGRNPANADEQLIVPSPDDIELFYELAMLGDMMKIDVWANELETGNNDYRCFAGRVRELAAGLKAKAILALAEQYRGDGQ